MQQPQQAIQHFLTNGFIKNIRHLLFIIIGAKYNAKVFMINQFSGFLVAYLILV